MPNNHAMESPRSINRFLLALLMAFTTAAFGVSIYYREFSILLGWFAAIALFFMICAVLAIFNVIVFAPVFWQLGKFSGERAPSTGQSSDDYAD